MTLIPATTSESKSNALTSLPDLAGFDESHQISEEDRWDWMANVTEGRGKCGNVGENVGK
jgi:hypothetical protein